MTGNFQVVLDTCVLAPMPLADLLLRLAEEPRLYLPLWSPDILEELVRTLQNKFHLSQVQTTYRLAKMQEHFPEALVDGYQPLVPQITNHHQDRHIVAAAIRANASLIVTHNRKHFPVASLEPWGIDVLGPGAFLIQLFDLDPVLVLAKLERQAADTRRSTAQLLELLARDVPSFASHLRSCPGS